MRGEKKKRWEGMDFAAEQEETERYCGKVNCGSPKTLQSYGIE